MRHRGTEPFVFFSTAHVVELTGRTAHRLAELRDGIRGASARTLFFHLVEVRLRLERCTNDLSYWLADALDAPVLAARLDQVNLLLPSTEEFRQQILRALEQPR